MDVAAVAVRELVACGGSGGAAFRRLARRRRWLRGAAFAEPDDREMGEARFVAELRFDRLAYGVELLGRDGGDFGAPFAVEVFDFVTADERVEAGSVSEVDVADESVALEHLEVSVDRGLVDRQRVGEVHSGDRTVGGEERLEHQPARCGEAHPSAADHTDRLFERVERERRGVRGDCHL